jgi:hypothetical protein
LSIVVVPTARTLAPTNAPSRLGPRRRAASREAHARRTTRARPQAEAHSTPPCAKIASVPTHRAVVHVEARERWLRTAAIDASELVASCRDQST